MADELPLLIVEILMEAAVFRLPGSQPVRIFETAFDADHVPLPACGIHGDAPPNAPTGPEGMGKSQSGRCDQSPETGLQLYSCRASVPPHNHTTEERRPPPRVGSSAPALIRAATPARTGRSGRSNRHHHIPRVQSRPNRCRPLTLRPNR
ncbi:hypothetical protein GCM10009735_11020 [Actinomadura chokoriensis]